MIFSLDFEDKINKIATILGTEKQILKIIARNNDFSKLLDANKNLGIHVDQEIINERIINIMNF